MITQETNFPLQYRELGTAELLFEGKDLLFISLGHMNQVALQIKEKLEQDDIHPTILDPVFVKPLDASLLLKLISSHKYVVTLEEHSLHGGLGSAIQKFIQENNLSPERVLHFGVPDAFFEQGSYKDISLEAGLTAEQIYKNLILELSLVSIPQLIGSL